MKNIKKIVALVLAMVLVAGLSVAGTVAYLTDRDAKTNIFTVGNVDISLNEAFGQGAALIPGVEINKVPTITNNGPTDAWVWMTFSIPSALDNFVQGTEQGSNKNIIHWNPLGATTEGYVTEQRVANAIQQGLLPEGTTADDILAANKTWNVFNSLGDGKNVKDEEINGVSYNTYVLLYNKALTKGETTLPSLFKVYLDAQIDIDPEGEMYRVVNGTATKVNWNIKTNGNPLIHIAAYGIQKDNFADVKTAYAAYNKQWGDNGRAEAEVPTLTKSADELKAALESGEKDIIVNGAEITENFFNGRYYKDRNIDFVDCTFTANMNYMYINDATFTNCTFDTGAANSAVHYDELFGDLVFDNCTFKSGKIQIGANKDMTGTVTFNDCVFENTASTSIWSDNGIRVYSPAVFNDCEFNNRVVLAGSNGLSVTFDNCTMNDGTPVYYVDNTDGIIRGGNIPVVTIR